jgi:hypothetical protein
MFVGWGTVYQPTAATLADFQSTFNLLIWPFGSGHVFVFPNCGNQNGPSRVSLTALESRAIGAQNHGTALIASTPDHALWQTQRTSFAAGALFFEQLRVIMITNSTTKTRLNRRIATVLQVEVEVQK